MANQITSLDQLSASTLDLNATGGQSMSRVQGDMKNIGNCLALRTAIDPSHRATKYIRSYLGTVDIVPVDYTLSLNVLNQDAGGWAVEYNFESAIAKYKEICGHYNLPKTYSGLRLWLTDDTQAHEEFKHQFDNNIIENAINKISGFGRSIRQLVQSTGVNDNVMNSMRSKLQNTVGNATQEGVKYIGDLLGKYKKGTEGAFLQQIENAVTQGVKTAAGIVFEGKQVSLPRIWKSSEYAPVVTFNIKLVAPYGHKEAIKTFIINPILYLLILTAPRSKDGLSYGLYQPVRVKGYGITNINLGAIDSVTIKRGGKATSYNVWKQPLTVDVAISVRPLADGFAVMEKGFNDIANFDAADWDYDEQATGSPAITTIGNVIQSFRPAPPEVVNQSKVESSASSPLRETGTGTGTLTQNATDQITSALSSIDFGSGILSSVFGGLI